MDLTPQDLLTLRNIALRTIRDVHEVLAVAAHRSKRSKLESEPAPSAPPPALASPEPSAPRTEPRLAYSIKDAAAALGLSRSTLYKLISDGELPAMRIGGRRLIAASDLQALIARSGA